MQKILLFVALLSTSNLFAQLNLDTPNASKTINFDNTQSGINNEAFNGGGFAPSPEIGQLNSNGIIILGLSFDKTMQFGSTITTDDFARGVSTGKVGTGGVYAFEVSSENKALGIQPGGSDFCPGAIILKVLNSTGRTINSINIRYAIYCYNDQDRSNYFKLFYSTDNTTYSELDGSLFLSPEIGNVNPSWTKHSFDLSFNVDLINNGELYIKWGSNDQGGSGSRDEFALDDIIITPSENNIPMDVNPYKETSVKIYPVPFQENVNIDAAKCISKITIMNAVGNQVLNISGNKLQKQTIETNNLNNGIYLIKVAFDDDSFICKKIVKH